ncbi:hypothetical protein IWW39_001686 [Coemansia spiralis]|uniref:Retinoic acid induced 16-like protein-domain-containing protein n=1 Tax=Coemansia spiralis TaxID=417178 RepID=A0A9W8GPR3_9FUNG|nr:hypothetical protein IWW39_001686 [Coemansia spiralis]
MEYFAKFTRHIAAPRKSQPEGATQLAKFEKAWKTIQSICYYQSKWHGMSVDKTPLPAQLVVMFDLLVQEDIQQSDSDDSTTGACMEYLLGNNILEELVNLAERDQPVGVRGVVISNLSTFVSLTDDKLLVQKAVHNPILELLRSYSAHRAAAAEAGVAQSVVSLFSTHQHIYDDDFVDLMYAICSKVRGEPMLLNIFFQDRRWLKSIEQPSTSTESFSAMVRSVESLHRDGASPPSSGYEFLLFSHLLQFVHLEGKAGDTARTSLLFLLELATTEIMASTGGNTALERFILDDSGFAAILSATLGAMYSQLPRSLRVSTGPSAVVPESFPSYSADLQNAIESSIFAAGADRGSMDRWTDDRGPMDSSNPEFRARLASFVHVIGFIQEVLFRCPSPHVCDQLLKNLRDNFLQAILYPSLLESSDTDGSSVAVMRYLEAMLQSARHEDLVSAIMDFLTDDSTLAQPPVAGAATSKRADSACLPFTLRDLVYSNLQSSVSGDAVVSALNLLRLVLVKHCRYSSRLIEVERVQPSGIKNGWMTNCTVAIDVHRQELDMYAKLMARLQSDNSSPSAGSKRDMMDVDSQALHIPWRQGTISRGTAFGDRAKFELRAAVPESFSLGYDEYLEDAALEWDAHQSYHSELDALFAAQAARSALLKGQPKLLPSLTAATSVGKVKQRGMRPRKYSEAVPASAGSKPGPRVVAPSHANSSSPTSPDTEASAASSASASEPADADSSLCGLSLPVPAKRTKHSIKQSDPIIRALMGLLTKYFAQPRECNLALTGVLAALVGCPHRTLDLWLGFNIPTLLNGVLNKPWCMWLDNLRNISDDERGADDSDSEGEDDPRGTRKPGGAPAAAIVTADASKYVGLDRELQMAVKALPSGATPPSLYLVISGLVQQAMVLQNEIPDFSRRLKRARNALMGIVEDVDDLDGELEDAGSYREVVLIPEANRSRDRGLSSASLENARSLTMASSSRALATSSMADSILGGTSNSTASKRNRNRSASGATSATRQSAGGDSLATKDAQSMTVSKLLGARMRAGSVGQSSEMSSPSLSSASVGAGGKATAAGLASVDASSPTSPAAHALSVPPANANLAEFLENVIILQESIKEIIARVQVRRENGGDEDAVS